MKVCPPIVLALMAVSIPTGCGEQPEATANGSEPLSEAEADARLNRATTLYEAGKYQEAIALFDEVAENQIDGPDGVRLQALAAHNAGSCYQELGELEESLIAYNRALEIDPEYARAYNSIGNSYMDMGNISLAEMNYRKAVETDPNHADAHYNLGNLVKDDEEAIRHYDLALAVTPDNPACHHNKGVRLLNLGRKEDAHREVTRAIRMSPGYGRAYYTRGVIREDLGNTAGAEEDFLMAKKLGIE